MALLKAPHSAVSNNSLLRSERIAGGILPRVLNTFDMIAIVVAIILWIPNAAVGTGAGTAAFIYWGLGFVTFLIPGAIITRQLGLMFPGEGSVYVWTTKACGEFVGFIAGFCAWWPGILSMIAAGDIVVSLIQHLGTLLNIQLLRDPGLQGIVIIILLVFSYSLSMLRFRRTQNLVNLIFLTYVGAILLIGLAAFFWLITGHTSNINFAVQSGNWSINSSNFTFYGTVVLALLGIEVPLNMGVEIKDVRSITRYLVWGSLVVMLAYLTTTLAVLIVVPLKDQGNPLGIIEAVQVSFGSAGRILAVVVDVVVIGFFIVSITVFNYSYARLLFVSGLDRRLPAIISKVGSKKVPWIAVLAQTIVGIIFTSVIFILAPLFLKSTELSIIIYNILLASVTVIWCVSMMMLFIDVIVIRWRYQLLFQRIRFMPGWAFSLCSITGVLASTFGIYVVFTSPWTNSARKIFLTTREWDAWIASITFVSLFVAIASFYIGQRTIKIDLKDEEIVAKITD
jgi:glutamate:GABA antiporter